MKKKLHINIIFGHSHPVPPLKGGGVENLFYDIAKSLRKQGVDVTIYSRKFKGQHDRETDSYGIKYIRLDGYDWHSNKLVNIFNSLRWCIGGYKKIEKADVSIFNSFFSFLYTFNNKIGKRAYVVHREPSLPLITYSFFDRVYCGSNFIAREAEKYVDAKKVRRVYNCIDTEYLPEINLDNNEEKDYVEFLYFGRLQNQKGVLELVQGFKELSDKYVNVKLKIIAPLTKEEGSDTLFLETLKNYIEVAKLSKKVDINGPIYQQDKLYATIAQSDVICLLTKGGDAMPITMLGSLYLKKPILASNFGPMPELVEHEVNGYVIDHQLDINDVFQGLEYFVINRNILPIMGEKSRILFEKEFTLEKVTNAYVFDFKELLQ